MSNAKNIINTLTENKSNEIIASIPSLKAVEGTFNLSMENPMTVGVYFDYQHKSVPMSIVLRQHIDGHFYNDINIGQYSARSEKEFERFDFFYNIIKDINEYFNKHQSELVSFLEEKYKAERELVIITEQQQTLAKQQDAVLKEQALSAELNKENITFYQGTAEELAKTLEENKEVFITSFETKGSRPFVCTTDLKVVEGTRTTRYINDKFVSKSNLISEIEKELNRKNGKVVVSLQYLNTRRLRIYGDYYGRNLTNEEIFEELIEEFKNQVA